MTVVKLSVTGVHLRTLLPHRLHVDDVVELAFSLDDGRHTEIHAQTLIRGVDHTQLGAACGEPHTYARELGV